jgi:hypothetical protein
LNVEGEQEALGSLGRGLIPLIEHRNNDFATNRLMLEFAFTAPGFHNVMLTFYECNLAGRLWDVVYMDCLAPWFTGSDMRRNSKKDKSLRSWWARILHLSRKGRLGRRGEGP